MDSPKDEALKNMVNGVLGASATICVKLLIDGFIPLGIMIVIGCSFLSMMSAIRFWKEKMREIPRETLFRRDL